MIKAWTDVLILLDNNYIIFILINLFLVHVVLTVILLTKPFLSFNNTILLESFNNDRDSLLDHTNFGITITAFALIPDLLCNIYHFFKVRSVELSYAALQRKDKIFLKGNWLEYINKDKQIGIIILKFLIIYGQGVPALLLIVKTSDSLQCVIYCATTYMQNNFFATTMLVFYTFSINQPKYYGLCVLVLLTFYFIANLLYTLRDFYYPLNGHKNATLEIFASVFYASLYISVFYAVCQLLFFIYSRLVGRFAPFSNPRKFEIFFITIIIMKSVIDSMFHVQEDRDEVPTHMTLINLMSLYYSIIISNFYVHEHFDNMESLNDSLHILNDQLSVEKSLLENFLYNLVPRHIVHKIIDGAVVQPEYLKYACIFYAEIHGFDEYSASAEPIDVFSLVHRLYSIMDCCLDCFSTLTKVQMSGNKYAVIAGLNYSSITDNGEADDMRRDLLADIVEFSLLVSEAAQLLPMDCLGKTASLCIGLHSGNVATGLTGQATPRFSMFGNTVNDVKMLEKTCEANKIQVSKDFAKDLQNYSSFDINLSSLYRLERREQNIETSLLKSETFWLLKNDHIKLKEKFSDEFDKIYKIVNDVGLYHKSSYLDKKVEYNNNVVYKNVDHKQVSITISETQQHSTDAHHE